MQRTVVAFDHIAGDGQAKARVAGTTVTRLIETGEALEDALPLMLGDPRAVVADFHDHRAQLTVRRLPPGAHGDVDAVARVADGIVDQVAQAALEITGCCVHRGGPGAV